MKLKTLRKKLGLTQAEIAPILGVSQTRVCAIEKGTYGRRESKMLQAHLRTLDQLAALIPQENRIETLRLLAKGVN